MANVIQLSSRPFELMYVIYFFLTVLRVRHQKAKKMNMILITEQNSNWFYQILLDTCFSLRIFSCSWLSRYYILVLRIFFSANESTSVPGWCFLMTSIHVNECCPTRNGCLIFIYESVQICHIISFHLATCGTCRNSAALLFLTVTLFFHRQSTGKILKYKLLTLFCIFYYFVFYL